MNWSLLQTAVGIDVQGGDFTAVVVKRQWQRISLADRLEIPNYQALGPLECGSRYREFLRQNGLKAPWTVVALPRSAVLLRWLTFPQAVENDLAQAVRFQLDSLHPFDEDSIYWDFASSKTTGAGGGAERAEALVAISQKKYVDELTFWFQQAGMGISQFTVTTAALLAALVTRSGGGALFVLHADPGEVQVTGYAPGSLVSTEVSVPPGQTESQTLAAVRRQLAVARSELRLDPEQRVPLVICGRSAAAIAEAADSWFAVSTIESRFPGLHAPAGAHLRDDAVAFAAALGAADRSVPFSLNLLPAERRSYRSPFVYAPAYALTGVILLLSIALGLRGSIQDWRYQQYVQREIQSLQPQLQAVEAAQEHSRRAYERLALLDATRNATALPTTMLSELTRLLPEDAWVQQLQFDGETVSLTGVAKSASPLLDTLASSRYFESPQFLSAISRYAEGKELFRIGVRLRQTK